MAHLLVVPELAAGTTEVELSEWLVQPGATVAAGESIAVVETEKAVVEIVADADGIVLRLLATAPATMQVGSPMALLGSDAELGADHDELLSALVSGASPSPAIDTDAATAGNDDPLPAVPPGERESQSPGVDTQLQKQMSTPAMGSGRRLFISPIARRLLERAGVDSRELIGTGPHGRIVRADAEAAIARVATDSESAESPGTDPMDASSFAAAATAHEKRTASHTPERQAGVANAATFEEVEHSRLRRVVATRLTESKQQVPHFYLRRTARVDALLDLRAQVNEHISPRVSVNDFVVRAVGVAHRAVPDANVVWTESTMRRYSSVDVSVAIASERGLVTPVLRSVESSTLSAISRQVREFVDEANNGRLRQHDLEGGSITVTNLGMYGIEEFAAIINPPQSAILAVGAAALAAVVVSGPDGPEVAVENALQLTLSVDHRAIDGALAAEWMQVLVDALENPIRLLT